MDLNHIDLDCIDLDHFDLNCIDLDHMDFNHMDLNHIDLYCLIDFNCFIDLNHIDLNCFFYLNHIDLNCFIDLTHIDLDLYQIDINHIELNPSLKLVIKLSVLLTFWIALLKWKLKWEYPYIVWLFQSIWPSSSLLILMFSTYRTSSTLSDALLLSFFSVLLFQLIIRYNHGRLPTCVPFSFCMSLRTI